MWNIKFLYNYVHFHELFLLFLLPHNHTGLAAKEKRALKHCLGMFVVCVEVLLFYHYTLVSISPPGLLLFCITLNA